MTITSHTTGEIRARLSVRRRLVAVLRRHRRSLAVLAPLLVVAGVVHAWGMATFPAWVDDPGTYLAQAWAVAHEHALSPYTYFYDHAPAGWIQLALWSLLTGGFDRYDTAMAFGNECMLLAKLVSCALLYALARRVGLARAWAAVAVLLFALSPLALVYTRWTFLDNLVTPWLLLAFVLVYSPRKSIGAAVGGSLAFAMAALTKETALVALPAFVYALAQNLDARNRAQVLVMSSFSGLLLMGMYPLFAILRGELLPAPGHTSLLGTAGWQLSGRGGSGSVFDAGSAAHGLVQSWLGYDAILLAGGVLAVPVALVERRLRPIVLLVALQALMLLRGGYVPFMHVILVLPLCALLIAAALDRLAGRRVWVAAVAGVAAAAVWAPSLWPMLTVRQAQPLHLAAEWVADNVPRDRTLVVHDSIWTDLTYRKGFHPVLASKLDSDPEVVRAVRHIDYLVLPESSYTGRTLREVRSHAVAVVSFGTVRVYRVSRYWDLR